MTDKTKVTFYLELDVMCYGLPSQAAEDAAKEVLRRLSEGEISPKEVLTWVYSACLGDGCVLSVENQQDGSKTFLTIEQRELVPLEEDFEDGDQQLANLVPINKLAS